MTRNKLQLIREIQNYSSKQIKTIIDKDDKYKSDIRLYAVYQLSKSKPSRRLEDLHNGSFKQVCNWADRFDKEGFGGLLNRRCSGRPTKPTQEQLTTLQSCLRKSLEQFGYNTANWSDPSVKDFLQKQFSVEYKQANAYNLMHSLGFIYQRTKGVLSERDERKKNKPK